MQNTQLFNEAYARLNAAQKEAVDTIEGPVMVIAGPGTGKTQILTLRIANILLKTDTDPSGILALTFTEAGATAMRERLARFIGSRAYQVGIYTFHGFAGMLVSEFSDSLSRLSEGSQIDEVEALSVLREAFDSVPAESLKTRAQPYRAIRDVQRFISTAKRELWTPEKLEEYYHREKEAVESSEDFKHVKGKYAGEIKGEYKTKLKKIAKGLDTVSVYRAYEETLEKSNRYDYDDLLLEVVRAFKADSDFKQEVQERFLYILADEHQDANATQNEILSLLVDFHEEQPNVFVVGDEKQAIYRFQGAELDTFLAIKERYSGTKVILLDTNYRSTQEVLDTAHSLIAPAPIPDESLRKELAAHHGSGAKVSVFRAEHMDAELGQLVRFITEKQKEGVSLGDIAVLIRRNGDALPISYALARAGIPHGLEIKQNIIEDPFVELLLSLFQYVWDQNQMALGECLFIPGMVTPEDRMRLFVRDRGDRLSDVLRSKEKLEAHGVSDPQCIVSLMEKLDELHELVHVVPVARAVPRIVHELGIVGHIGTLPHAHELYGALEGLLKDVEQFGTRNPKATLGAYLERISVIKEHEVRIERKPHNRGGVHILTAHGSKGLEFPYVVVPFATDNRFGKVRGDEIPFPHSEGGSEHDERRLMYVALTRAEKEALITYSVLSPEGRAQAPSRFIEDIEVHVAECTHEPVEVGVVGVPESQSLIDPLFIVERLQAQGISATAYGNFCRSPWDYFFSNVLRLPEGKSLSLIYGNAVHAALEQAVKLKRENAFSMEKVEAVFIDTLEHSPLTEKEFETEKEKGLEAIRAYIESSVHEVLPGEVEYSVSAPITVPGIGEVMIRGKLDRIDVLDGKRVRVVDYKTGKVKSRNDVMGQTAKADPSYHVQILFYALLLAKDPANRFQFEEGVLSFVEPNESGKYVEHSFKVTENELAEFEAKLVSDLEQIARGDFGTCDENVSRYCDLVTVLRFDAAEESDQ